MKTVISYINGTDEKQAVTINCKLTATPFNGIVVFNDDSGRQLFAVSVERFVFMNVIEG